MKDPQPFVISIVQQQDYQFLVQWDNDAMLALIADEPPPLGRDAGPSPDHLLAAAIGNCLTASLLFALRKFKNKPGPLQATVTGHIVRNETGRLRVGSVDVRIAVGSRSAELQHVDQILSQFEDFCVVTQSVRSGFPVRVEIVDQDGEALRAMQPAG